MNYNNFERIFRDALTKLTRKLYTKNVQKNKIKQFILLIIVLNF